MLAPDAAARVDDLAPVLVGHARTEPVAALADEPTRLIRAFHGGSDLILAAHADAPGGDVQIERGG